MKAAGHNTALTFPVTQSAFTVLNRYIISHDRHLKRRGEVRRVGQLFLSPSIPFFFFPFSRFLRLAGRRNPFLTSHLNSGSRITLRQVAANSAGRLYRDRRRKLANSGRRCVDFRRRTMRLRAKCRDIVSTCRPIGSCREYSALSARAEANAIRYAE